MKARVALLHLFQDFRDRYPGPLKETIVSEIVANARDSGARTVAFTTDPALRSLTVLDDGAGMSRAELRRYHDLAASTKARKGRAKTAASCTPLSAPSGQFVLPNG